MTTTATLARTIRQMLQAFDFRRLFNQLGWDNPPAALSVEVGGVRYSLQAVAEKRGMTVFVCEQPAGATFPDRETRQRIEAQVVKSVHSHIIIYVDSAQTRQVWQWARREHGKSTAVREHRYFAGQSGENLAQRLAQVFIAFDEEDGLTGVEVQARAAKAFDVDRVTKKFYDRFKTEHSAFLQRIEGIGDDEAREWYASLMLNRLMFTYFIQKKGFLAGDVNYLSSKLLQVRARYGDGQFHSFYRSFLLRLFHEGLGQPKTARDAETVALIGDIPYLNGGLFEIHQIERDYPDITIPDEAFERIFAFFDSYVWHLDTEHEDERHPDNEINPDVLGYIFEKYINQKQMGAYYTKEDITEYIGKNTILPFVLEQARANCKVAFERPESEVWRLLSEDPDRYIYPAVLKGVDLPLPPEIAAGVGDVARRGGWNRPADPDYALPTETWREHVARRTRCLDLRAKLSAGEVTSVNDLITYNLDIRRFTQDVIENCEGPDLLRALWDALSTVTILDPTCGSGAFLFAALTILEPLYTACLERMDAFVKQADATPNASRALYSDFRATLEQVGRHSNRRYFILKSIIISNLYGVDIMEEAVEIAKLRLFLKLVAQVDDVRRLEPLPDIDFNIRAGNTLVGFATLDAVRDAINKGANGAPKLLLTLEDEASLARINERAEIVGRAYQQFREMQTTYGMDAADFHTAKAELTQRLGTLTDELDTYLARDYRVDARDAAAFAAWRASHRPFHWCVEFYGIVQAHGGFDVIIGNPPYVEYSKVRAGYAVRNSMVEACGNLYAFILERCFRLLEKHARFGMIVPVSLLCTERMIPLQALVLDVGHSWASSFDMRPSSLFFGVSQRLTILLTAMSIDNATVHLGGYRRWKDEERETLIPNQEYVEYPTASITLGYVPKISEYVERSIAAKVQGSPMAAIESSNSTQSVYVHRIVRYFVKALDFVPHFWNEADGNKKSEDYKPFTFMPQLAAAMGATINSSTFYWFWHCHSDGFHCGYRDVRTFGLNHALAPDTVSALTQLNRLVMADLKKNANRRVVYSRTTGRIEYDEIYSKPTKPIIDEIDRVLAQHYGFTDEELDFIINYDIKYRMGQSGGEDEEEEGGE